MTPILTFYLSRVIGNDVVSTQQHKTIGKLQDLIVDVSLPRPKVIAAKVKIGKHSIFIDSANIAIIKEGYQYHIHCSRIDEITIKSDSSLFLAKHILDMQVVDIDGKKLERVNDIRLTILSSGVFVIAVDTGIEGLLRRLSIAKPINQALKPIGYRLPNKLILWDDIATIGFSQEGIKLSKEYSKLSTLHPSDLADIIEDLDRKSQVAVFTSLDEERAADVLEELETKAQVNLLESISTEKAADVLEKMPADEVADILDDLEEEKAEELLSEMEKSASKEVRELIEYPENTVGSLMTTEFHSFKENLTVEQTINELRRLKPESDTIYYLYILGNQDQLVGTVALRDLIISSPETKLKQIMNTNVIKVYDQDKIDSLAEIISKYNLIALPVVNREDRMEGMVIIDDVVFTLLKTRKHKAFREE